jgi:hypothetical protein
VGAAGEFLGCGLVSAPVRGDDVLVGTVVALVRQKYGTGGRQFADDAPDPDGGQVVRTAGQGRRMVIVATPPCGGRTIDRTAPLAA